MADSEAAMIMAKVHECKRKAHDLRNEAHALTARAAIKAVHLLAARGKICSLRRAAGERGQWPAVEIERALGQPRRAEWAENFERARPHAKRRESAISTGCLRSSAARWFF
jgi:hypothetical protein